MLIISRKLDQTFTIDGNIDVKVLGLVGNAIKLGFSAPMSVAIHRDNAVKKDSRHLNAQIDPAAWDKYQAQKSIDKNKPIS